jgi:UDP-N-acetylglucosamine 2-epimerase (non-hydrolysing)
MITVPPCAAELPCAQRISLMPRRQNSARMNWRCSASKLHCPPLTKTILVFAGTRPEIIKMAPIVRELRARQVSGQRSWRVHFCFSGQHDELALPFLKYFEVEPDSRLEVMAPGKSLGQLVSRATAQLDAFIEKHSSICAALVQGDTTTAFSAALSAFYHQIPVGHVEAGLRTSNIGEPFPEELNRRLIARIARWHYAPTEIAKQNLVHEGVPAESVLVTGNTGIDSFLWTINRSGLPKAGELRALTGKRIVLVTVHRRENLRQPLERITAAVAELARQFDDVQFVVPVHKNPEVSGVIRAKFRAVPNIHLTEPLEYADLIWIMKSAELILTDSGGIQEEAPSLDKPVLVLRNETERVEAVAYGTSFVVGSDTPRIVSTAKEFLSGSRKLAVKAAVNPYGDGTAATRIVDHLLSQIAR